MLPLQVCTGTSVCPFAVPPRSLDEAERLLQIFYHFIHNRACRCSLDHPESTTNKIWFVEIRISAAFSRTIFIDATKIALQERAGSSIGLPRILAASLRPFEIFLDEFLTLHAQTTCHPIDLFFAEAGLQLSATISAARTIDCSPYPSRGLKNTLVDIVLLQIALRLQKPAKADVLVFFPSGQFSDLNQISPHKRNRITRCYPISAKGRDESRSVRSARP